MFNRKLLALLVLTLPVAAQAHPFVTFDAARQYMSTYTLDCAHWYVGGNIGVSKVWDRQTDNTVNSVDETGPGWNVLGGYQWNSLFGVEMGYTQYDSSRETNAGFVLAKTQHYSAQVDGTFRYPLFDRLSALGKLGAAYSYWQKIFYTNAAAASSGAVSLYWGLGLDYSMTQKVDFIAQFARARGNHLSGSNDLYSIGFTFAIV